MAIKRYNPTTPGRRHASVIDYKKVLTRSKPDKSLVILKKNTAGRNNQGKITVRHKGGGGKKFLRVIDFKRDKLLIEAKVETVEYDPNRTAFICRVCYIDGERRYIVAPEGLKVGDKIMSSRDTMIPITTGNAISLELIPSGVIVHNIELTPGKGAELTRSAGSGAVVQVTDGAYTQIKLSSGEVRLVPRKSLATIGQVSNVDHRNVRLGKAGRMRHLGVRPTVRGTAMNPVDHPHGGGEGHTSIGLKGPKTVYGKPAYGVKTRKPGKASSKLIISKKKKK